MNCLECGARSSVVVKKRISESFKDEIEEIEKEEICLKESNTLL